MHLAPHAQPQTPTSSQANEPIMADSRLDNTTTCLPLAYGSIAFYLGKEADEYHTHRWTLYVRSPDPKFDLSSAIEKVVFQLHPSFPQPTRELTEPPFEVTESGWGEFDASIRIIWKEVSDERSTLVSNSCDVCGCYDVLISFLFDNLALTQPICSTVAPTLNQTLPTTGAAQL